jgi:hypothetical protein
VKKVAKTGSSLVPIKNLPFCLEHGTCVILQVVAVNDQMKKLKLHILCRDVFFFIMCCLNYVFSYNQCIDVTKYLRSSLPVGSEHPFIGSEPACSISIGVAKKAVRDWTDRNHKKYWESTTGLKQAKGFISGPSAR